MSETFTIDRLFLELSQFTKAKTETEIQLEEVLIKERVAVLEVQCLLRDNGHDKWADMLSVATGESSIYKGPHTRKDER